MALTTTREYSSTDAGAPVLTGQVGSLRDVLRACLVDGYGSGGSAKAPAGWAAAFTGTNKIVFRNAVAAGGTGHCFRIADDGTEAAGARVALLRGYVDMSDVDTGIGADVMPAVGDYATGGQICKSNTADSTARAWRVFADELTCWVWTDPSGGFMHGLHGFGDIESVVPGDSYRSFVLHQASAWTSNNGGSRIHSRGSQQMSTPILAQTRGLSVMRGYSGTPAGAVLAATAILGEIAGNYGAGGSGGVLAPIASAANPGAVDRYYHRMPICAQGGLRGYLRGLYICLNDLRSLPQGTVESGSAGLPPGSVLRLMRLSGGTNSAAEGVVGLETAVAW